MAFAAGIFLVSTSTKRVLLGQRSMLVPEPHTWSVWGGHVDRGERPEDAAVRELAEEAGYEGPVRLVRLPPGWCAQGVYENFLGLIDAEFEPRLTWETKASRWAPLDYHALPRPLHPGLVRLLADPRFDEVLERHVGQRMW